MSGPLKLAPSLTPVAKASGAASNDATAAAAALHTADLGRQQASIAPALFTDDQAAAFWGVSVRRFHELRAESWAPAPITLGPRLLRWSRAELEAAIAAMPRADKRSEPAQLARARVERLKSSGVPV
jgi:predicted DNA-binding transcriptional regulator AlpA